MKTKRGLVGRVCLWAIAGVLLVDLAASQSTFAQCNNISGGTLTVNANPVHIGQVINYTVGLQNSSACDASNVVGTLVMPNHTNFVYITDATLLANNANPIQCPGGPGCAPGPYTYTVSAADLTGSVNNVNCPNFGSSTNPKNKVIANATGFGYLLDAQTGEVVNNFTDCRNVTVSILQPCIEVTKECQGFTGESGTITFGGVAHNCGNTTLFNVTVTDSIIGEVLSIPQLAAGQSTNYSGSYYQEGCGPSTDTVTASGTDTLGSNVTAQASATCSNTVTPCLQMTKACHNPSEGNVDITFDGTAYNCGDVTLENVTVYDIIEGGAPIVVTNFPSLAPGETGTYTGSYTPTTCPSTDFVRGIASVAASCGNTIVTNTTGEQTCGQPRTPHISVTKNCQVTGDCETPTIQYSGIVTNDGGLDLVNVNVHDDVDNVDYNIGSLAIGESKTYGPGVYTAVDNPSTNSVLATGDSVGVPACGGGTIVSNTASCIRSFSGRPCIRVTRDCEILEGNTNMTIRGTVTNCGDMTLTSVTVTDTDCGAVIDLESLAVGATESWSCTIPIVCPNSFTGSAHAEGHDTTICAPDTGEGRDRTVTSDASSTCECQTEGCRTTGGGKQYASENQVCPIVDPAFNNNVRYVTHGGQVGASYGASASPTITNCTTGAGTGFNNPCIRGEYQHVRHMKGGLRGTFHAAGNGNVHEFDSLKCACLPCDTYETSNPFGGCHPADRLYTGDGITEDGLCNPGRTPNCGPEPRKAPSNKLAFSGLSTYTKTNGKKTVPVVFRVDIEDRGEPGNLHAISTAGKTNPPDRYRMRLWFVGPGTQYTSEAAIKRLREAVAVKDAHDERVGTVFGGTLQVGKLCDGSSIVAPDIDDGGDLDRGNRQIHPNTGASCQ